jgi:hypothetical protein
MAASNTCGAMFSAYRVQSGDPIDIIRYLGMSRSIKLKHRVNRPKVMDRTEVLQDRCTNCGNEGSFHPAGEVSVLLGCGAALLCNCFPTFRDNTLL